MIRYAKLEDIREIKRLGRMFFKYSKVGTKGLKWNGVLFEKYLMALINQEVKSIILVSEGKNKLKGSIAGILYPWMCDLNQLILIETWWYVDPKYWNTLTGGNLIREFEKQGKMKGADLIIMISMKMNEFKLRKFYENIGYKPLEYHFIKEL